MPVLYCTDGFAGEKYISGMDESSADDAMRTLMSENENPLMSHLF